MSNFHRHAQPAALGLEHHEFQPEPPRRRPVEDDDDDTPEGIDGIGLPVLKEPAKPSPLPDMPKTIQKAEDAFYEMNRRFAIVLRGGKCCVMVKPHSPEASPSYIMPDAFRAYYAHLKAEGIDDKGEKRLFDVAKEWWKSPHADRFRDVIFDPTGKAAPDVFNLWRGFAVKPRAGRWNRMAEHITDVICDGKAERVRWLTAWMARLVQDPGELRGPKPGVVPCLRGGQGSGKGVLWNSFRLLFGGHALQLTEPKSLAGGFSGHLEQCLFCFADEAFFAGDPSIVGRLKAIITEPVLMIEPKGFQSFQVPNYINLAMASNEAWMVPAGEDERRFCVFDVSPRRVGQHDYFAAIIKERDQGGLAAMLHDLLALDISGIELKNYPRTAALMDQKLQSAGSVVRFWHECLSTGELIAAEDENARRIKRLEWSTWPDKPSLYQGYLLTCERWREHRTKSRDVFYRELQKLCPALENRRPWDTADRTRLIAFPNLDESREAFAAFLGQPVDWPKVD